MVAWLKWLLWLSVLALPWAPVLRAQNDDGMVGAAPLAPLSAPAPEAQTLLRLTNLDRAAAGLAPVVWNQALAAAATAHAQQMIRAGQLEHQLAGERDLLTRAAAAGARFSAVAENIAYAGDPDRIEQQWMHSPGHRANILDARMNAVGIGVAYRGGELWAVADFASTVPVLSLEQIEAAVRGEVAAVGRPGLAPLRFAADPAQARSVCQGGSAPGFSLVWQGPDLALPAPALGPLRSAGYSEAAVGACPPRMATGQGFTSYRIALLLR